MLAIIFISIFITLPLSLYLLYYWKHLKKFILLNIIFALIYLLIIYFFGDIIWGNDIIGIFTFFRFLIPILIHILLIFIFALYKSFALRNEKKYD